MDLNKLVGPSGKPLIQEPGLIVIKSENPIPQQMATQISKITGCSVITIPMNVELLKGNAGARAMAVVHNGIHQILRIPSLALTKEELSTASKALSYTVRSMQLAEDSPEAILSKRIEEVI